MPSQVSWFQNNCFLTLDSQLNFDWGLANNKQTMYFIFAIKNKHESFSPDNDKFIVTKKEMSTLFSCDYLTTHYRIVKCCQNVEKD